MRNGGLKVCRCSFQPITSPAGFTNWFPSLWSKVCWVTSHSASKLFLRCKCAWIFCVFSVELNTISPSAWAETVTGTHGRCRRWHYSHRTEIWQSGLAAELSETFLFDKLISISISFHRIRLLAQSPLCALAWVIVCVKTSSLQRSGCAC